MTSEETQTENWLAQLDQMSNASIDELTEHLARADELISEGEDLAFHADYVYLSGFIAGAELTR